MALIRDTNPAFTLKESLPWIIIVCGILLRLFHYIENRSLWLEEAFLSYNFFNRNFTQLFQQPLDYDQQAPIGFLVIEDLVVDIFGQNEYALRFFPLICGIAAVILFYKLASIYLSKTGTIIALLCLSISNPSVYHSTDVKQYSLELLISVLLYLSYFFYRNRITPVQMLKWGAIGGIAVWFSYSSVFILGGIGIAMFWDRINNKEYKLARYLLIAFFIWTASFLANFFIFAFRGTKLEWMIDYWTRVPAFFPFPPRSFADFKIIFNLLRGIFDYPLGLGWQYIHTTGFMRVSIIGIGCFIIGLVTWYKKKFDFFLALSIPLALTILASGLTLYPFFQRLLLFMLPSLLLITVKGLEVVYQQVRSYSRIAGNSILVIFVLPLIFNSIHLTLHPEKIYKRLDTREAVQFLNSNVLEGEIIYDVLNHDMGVSKYKEGVILNCIKTIHEDIHIKTHLLYIYNKNIYNENNKLIVDHKNSKSAFPKTRFWFIVDENLYLEEDEGFATPVKQEEYIKDLLQNSGGVLEKEYKFVGIKILYFNFTNDSLMLNL